MTAPRLIGGTDVRELAARRLAPASRILIVSNRLPATVRVDEGQVQLTPSSGGLATGLRGVHDASASTWIGWSGAPADPRAR